MLAVPIVSGEQSIGLLEVFSTQPRAFEERHSSLLLRFADAVVAALSRTSAAEVPIHEKVAAPQISWTPPGSVLFAQAPQAKSSAAEIPNQPEEKTRSEDEISFGKIHLSRTRLYLLITVAAAVALALGFILAPWFHEKFHSRAKTAESPVLASSSPSTLKAKLPTPATRLTTLEQLRELAQSSDPAAENALGLLYAQGDEKQGIAQNESEAARWFTKAAEHGSVPAQYKLGLLFWGGHGVPKDATKAYFWAVLARAGGQDGSKDLAKVLANGMTRAQSAAIEQQAEIWYQQHQPKTRADASQ